MTTVTRLPIDTAFVTFLRNNLAQQVYFGHVPADAALPYVCVYGIPGGHFTGPPLAAPEDDAEVIFQATCVGGTPGQAVWMDDQVRQLVVGRTANGSFVTNFTVAGVTVVDRHTDGGGSAAIETGGLWQTTPRFSISITP